MKRETFPNSRELIKEIGLHWLVRLSWLEYCPMGLKVVGLISNQDTGLGCRFCTLLGYVREATDRCFRFTPNLSFSLPFSKHVLWWGLKRKEGRKEGKEGGRRKRERERRKKSASQILFQLSTAWPRHAFGLGEGYKHAIIKLSQFVWTFT